MPQNKEIEENSALHGSDFMTLNLAEQFNPVAKPSFGRNKPKRGNHTKFSLRTRKAIIARDEGLCVRCKRPYHSIHHCVFASSGGSGTVDNGVLTCLECHQWAHAGRKGRKWFEQYQDKYLIPALLKG